MLSKMEDFDRSVRDELKLLSDTVTAVQDSIPSQVFKFLLFSKEGNQRLVYDLFQIAGSTWKIQAFAVV